MWIFFKICIWKQMFIFNNIKTMTMKVNVIARTIVFNRIIFARTPFCQQHNTSFPFVAILTGRCVYKELFCCNNKITAVEISFMNYKKNFTY